MESATARRPSALRLPRTHPMRAELVPELAPASIATAIDAVDPAIFRRTVAPECMAFCCSFRADPGRTVLDACCSWGVDADAAERARIESRRAEIEPHLDPASRGASWFREKEIRDRDFPTGRAFSTRVRGRACVFLRRTGGRRGCGLHALGLKPMFCSLFPLLIEKRVLTHVRGDLTELTCSQSGPTVYRVGRETLGRLFGDGLLRDCDALEARHVAR
jgi:Fe-S-cluster containining protein